MQEKKSTECKHLQKQVKHMAYILLTDCHVILLTTLKLTSFLLPLSGIQYMTLFTFLSGFEGQPITYLNVWSIKLHYVKHEYILDCMPVASNTMSLIELWWTDQMYLECNASLFGKVSAKHMNVNILADIVYLIIIDINVGCYLICHPSFL